MIVPSCPMPRNTREERLPFTVSVASTAQMRQICELRSEAYGRHLPGMAAALSLPEAADDKLGCEVLVASSKLDGSVLGTLRTHSNLLDPIPLESAVDLERAFKGDRLVEATRLCIAQGTSASLVRSALFKALFLYAEQQNIDWLVACGRRPLDVMYDRLLFTDILEHGAFYPLSYAADLPHRIMRFNVGAAQALWAEHSHPLYGFVFDTHYPDIDLSATANLRHADWREACPTMARAAQHRPVQPGLSPFGVSGSALQGQ